MNLEYFIIPYPKVNSKGIKYLNERLNIIKFMEENIKATVVINIWFQRY